MVNVHDYAHNLARALKESPEHKAYTAAKGRLKERPTAEQMVTDFHKKQIELQAAMMQGKEPSAEQQEQIQQLYGIIQGDSDVREYLTAEQRLSVLLNDVYRILGEAMDLQVG